MFAFIQRVATQPSNRRNVSNMIHTSPLSVSTGRNMLTKSQSSTTVANRLSSIQTRHFQSTRLNGALGRIPTSSSALQSNIALTAIRARITSPLGTSIREYRSHKAISFKDIKTKQRAKDLDNKRVKPKSHTEMKQRLRLTRFGWERRRAGYGTSGRATIARKAKKRYKTTAFVNRVDIHKIERCVLTMKLKLLDLPRDDNPNLMPIRHIFPSWFG